jgi:DNA helicase-2/ATP-dependent DNA helicase PcrA
MKLTQSQQKAVESNAPAILVMAGAGSGKTATTVKRISRLLSDGANPASILCITFTRKAANELKERIAKEVGKSKASQIWAGTFHSISYRILMQWGEKIGYNTANNNQISVVSPEESEALMNTVLDEYKYSGTKKALSLARTLLSHDGREPQDYDIKRIISEYHARLKECNAVDFDQLLLEVHRLFKSCSAALEFYQNKFEHIFIDEYQDTDRIQYNLHEVLKPKNLFAVGDDYQGIYSFRGAKLDIILSFQESHKDAEIIKLEHCFRCGDKIVEAANNLIKNNINQLDKTLIGATGKEGVVEVVENTSYYGIADYVSENMCFIHPSDIAIIARNHRTLERLEKELVSAGIENHRVGKETRTIEGLDCFKKFKANLRLAANPKDNLAFLTMFDWLNSEFNFPTIRAKAIEIGGSWFQGYLELHGIRYQSLPEHSIVHDWLAFVLIYSEKFIDDDTAFLVKEYLEKVYGEITPEEFLKANQLKDQHLELEKASKEKITLLTAHASKGLEWENVLLVDFQEKYFPSNQAIKSQNLEEERRLAYVATTRAKERLLIFSRHSKKPSRFIEEMKG